MAPTPPGAVPDELSNPDPGPLQRTQVQVYEILASARVILAADLGGAPLNIGRDHNSS